MCGIEQRYYADRSLKEPSAGALIGLAFQVGGHGREDNTCANPLSARRVWKNLYVGLCRNPVQAPPSSPVRSCHLLAVARVNCRNLDDVCPFQAVGSIAVLFS
jgi:hypothetical protein